jgi:DNA-directed RNA polymerase specialized sigma24 family protein
MTVGEEGWLADRFGEYRDWLRAVAYRMLGSAGEADDAVRETWRRLTRPATTEAGNVAGWLTAITVQVCLDMRASRARGQEPSGGHSPGPPGQPEAPGPPDEAALAASAAGAVPVVLGTLAPAERLAFVLHEMFGVGFEAIAPVLGRSPAAAEVLARSARHRLGGAGPGAGDRGQEQDVAGAFLDACRWNDIDALQAVLSPGVAWRADAGTEGGGHPAAVRGPADVALQALMFHRVSAFSQPALVNGVPGLIAAPLGRSLAVLLFTIRDGKIAAIDVFTDPARLAKVDLTIPSK